MNNVKYKVGQVLVGHLLNDSKSDAPLELVVVGISDYQDNGTCYEYVQLNLNNNIEQDLIAIRFKIGSMYHDGFFDYQPCNSMDKNFELSNRNVEKEFAGYGSLVRLTAAEKVYQKATKDLEQAKREREAFKYLAESGYNLQERV